MADAVLEIPYVESHNRVTTLFRHILAIPHLIVSGVWGYFIQLMTLVQWIIVLFTGKRNEGIFNLQTSYVGYSMRVSAYVSLMYDTYPPFGTDPGQTGIVYSLAYESEANRLSNALRFFWLIPALFISFFVGIGAGVMIVISWFAILFTGKQPQGMFDFIRRWLQFSVKVTTYASLMTDTYPKFV